MMNNFLVRTFRTLNSPSNEGIIHSPELPFNIHFFYERHSFLSISYSKLLLFIICNIQPTLQVKCLEMTARWSGVSAPTVSTCTAS